MPNSKPFFSQAIINAKKSELEEVYALVSEGKITSVAALAVQTDLLKSVLAERDTIEAMRKSATKPANESLALVNSWFKPVVTLCDQIAAQLKSQVAEYMRAQRELQDRAYRDAVLSLERGDTDQARAALAVASQTTTETLRGTVIKEQWAFEIADPAALPREYLTPDLIAISKALRGAPIDQPAPAIAGVRVFLKAIVSQRRG